MRPFKLILKTLSIPAATLFVLLSLTGCTGAMVKFDNSRIYSLNAEAKQIYLQGKQYSGEGKSDEAIEAFTRSIQISPSAAAYNDRCVEYNRKGYYDAAMADASKAIFLSPRYAAPYFNRGNSYFKKADYEGALRDYTKAIELDPDEAEFYFNCGLAYFKKGQDDAAAGQYEKAIAKDQKFFPAYYNLAVHFSIKRETGRALELLEKAVRAGFSDAGLMKRDPGLDNIRNTGKFRYLLLKLERNK